MDNKGLAMTYQEALWQGKYVWVTGILSKRGRIHMSLRPYVGCGGMVLKESKNGQLLVQFRQNHTRCIPAGCIAEYSVTKVLIS